MHAGGGRRLALPGDEPPPGSKAPARAPSVPSTQRLQTVPVYSQSRPGHGHGVLFASSGGTQGCVFPGQMQAVLEHYRDRNVVSPWKAMRGVSAGGLAVASFAMFERGKEAEALVFMRETMEEIVGMGRTGMFGSLNPFVCITGRAMSASNVKRVLRQRLSASTIQKIAKDPVLGLDVGVTAVCSENGAPAVITSQHPMFVELCAATFAIPVVFERVHSGGLHFVDGAVRRVLPDLPACWQPEDVVDAFLAHPTSMRPTASAGGSAIDVGLRSLSLLKNSVLNYNLDTMMQQAVVNVYQPVHNFTDPGILQLKDGLARRMADEEYTHWCRELGVSHTLASHDHAPLRGMPIQKTTPTNRALGSGVRGAPLQLPT